MRNTERNDIEKYFEWYINELIENGYVEKMEREPFSFELLPKQNEEVFNIIKQSPVIEEKKLFNALTYKFDYMIVWTEKSMHYFFNPIGYPPFIFCPFKADLDVNGKYVSFVDVKPVSAASAYVGNSYVVFPIMQKLLWYYHKIFVNKAVPFPVSQKVKNKENRVLSGNQIALFTTTFLPRRYLMTDAGKQARQINYTHISLREYIAKREKELNYYRQKFNQQSLL